MSIKVLRDLVAIRVEEPKSTSSLIQVTPEAPTRGVVFAVGPDVKEIRVGDCVDFGMRKPQKIDTDKEDAVIIKEDDIFVVLNVK